MFDYKGIIAIEKEPGLDEDQVMMDALEAGAEDVVDLDEVFEISTAPNDFSAVREALESKGYSFLSAERAQIPQVINAVTDEETLQKIGRMLEMLDENDDVVQVYHNADLPEEEDEE